jgi:hypothetical protein
MSCQYRPSGVRHALPQFGALSILSVPVGVRALVTDLRCFRAETADQSLGNGEDVPIPFHTGKLA